MWEQEEFEKHWRNEFPDGEVPKMNLSSVEDVEKELERCKAKLKTLQQALSEEKFKVIYLQTTIAQKKKSYDTERWGSKEEDEAPTPAAVEVSEVDGSKPVSVAGKVERLDSKVHTRVKLPGLGSIGSKCSEELSSSLTARSDLARGSKTGKPILVPPRKKPVLLKESSSGPVLEQQPVRDLVQQQKVEERDSDHEYEDVELNENFVRRNLLNPKAKAQLRWSRDLDSGDEGRLSPSMPSRCSFGSGRSTPDRRSDGYISSDHDDSSSAGRKIKTFTFNSQPHNPRLTPICFSSGLPGAVRRHATHAGSV
ncbi:hypothetical protein MHYP_G00278720 [Metynnis hypsauchen]